MNHKEKIAKFLAEQDIKLPVSEFIAITSKIYHKFEATLYDGKHVSIQLSIPSWDKTLDELSNHFLNGDRLNVLDFGCGTGFAIERILSSQFKERCGHITCFDLSPDMINVCKEKFVRESNITYLSNQDGLKELMEEKGKFDLILCNAVLHHILEIDVLFPNLINYLKPNGVVIFGHEPNKNFFKNNLLASFSNVYRWIKRVENKLMRFMKIKRGVTPEQDIFKLTYNELRRRGIIRFSFPLMMIPKLIGIHIPLSSFKEQPWGEFGFNPEFFEEASKYKMQVTHLFTYNHIKDQNAYSSLFWNNISKILALVYPKDGADAIFILKQKTN